MMMKVRGKVKPGAGSEPALLEKHQVVPNRRTNHYQKYRTCKCVVWDYDERKGEDETRCRLIACSSRKAPRGPPGLMSPSDGRIAINSMCNCVVWDDDEKKGGGETRCRLIVCSSRKAPRGPRALMSPSDWRIAINSTCNCVVWDDDESKGEKHQGGRQA